MLYAEAVGLLSREMRTLAVAGAHGKTSTTAMLAAALRGGGVDASHLVGGDVPTLGGGGHATLLELALRHGHVSLGLHQRALAVHHPRAGLLAELFYVCGTNLHGHFFQSLS